MGTTIRDQQASPARRHSRIGVIGYAHEVNMLAEPVRSSSGVDESLLPGGLAANWIAGPVLQRLAALAGNRIEVVELPVWDFGASGPLVGDDFRSLMASFADRLDAALAAAPLDGVVVLGHGAGRSTDDHDTDATFLELLRGRIGDDVPVVTVLDFHANLSDRMCAAVDVIVGYRTNPHIDVVDCSIAAAEHVLRLVDARAAQDGAGRATAIVWSPLPVVLPQIAQLTTPGEPLHEVMAHARTLDVLPIRDVSVFGGFSLGDTATCGTAVAVTVDVGHEDVAAAAVRSLAEHIWSLRQRYRLHTTPLADATVLARAAAGGERPPTLFADVADNPGGGAPATSTHVLRALLDAGVTSAVMGVQCDRAVVEAAWAAGVGGRLTAVFNAGSTRPLAPELSVAATVVGLEERELVPSRGVYAGSPRRAGRCAALDLGGIEVAVSTNPVQCADDDTLRHVGLQPDTARVVVVKSRGHFRAGFDHLFPPEQIVEVGAPGVAPVDLHTVDWQHLRRPIWPLDDIEWKTPEPRLARRPARAPTETPRGGHR